MIEYLNQPNVIAVYQPVSARCRARWVHFQAACASNPLAEYNKFAAVDLAAAYDEWEGIYLTEIQANMRASVS